MKTIKITYWTATAILSIMILFSAYSYFANPAIAQAFHHLGFPDYFRIELAVAKLIGVVLLLAPVAGRVKEWAYAGFTITFISAFIGHTALGDPAANRVGPVIFLILLVTSYITYHKLPGKSLKITTA
jgi:putative copper export protein